MTSYGSVTYGCDHLRVIDILRERHLGVWLRAVQWYLACSALFWEHLLCCQLETFQLLWIKKTGKAASLRKKEIYMGGWLSPLRFRIFRTTPRK